MNTEKRNKHGLIDVVDMIGDGEKESCDRCEKYVQCWLAKPAGGAERLWCKYCIEKNNKRVIIVNNERTTMAAIEIYHSQRLLWKCDSDGVIHSGGYKIKAVGNSAVLSFGNYVIFVRCDPEYVDGDSGVKKCMKEADLHNSKTES